MTGGLSIPLQPVVVPLMNRAALESHFGIHLDSDESDLDVPSDDEWTDSGKF